MEERRPNRNPVGRDRSGRGLSRHDWWPRYTSRNTRWEPVSTRRRPSRRKDDDSVGDREQEEPSTPILETSAVADQRKTEETAGGGEELETDAEVGSRVDEARNKKHVMRPVEGQETSMHTEEPHRATDDDGRITPSRGENEEEENDDDSWHDAREDWWEAAAFEKATNGDEAAPKTTSGGAATLHPPALEAPTVGLERRVVAEARRATKMKTRGTTKILAGEGKTPRHQDRRLRRLCPSANIRPERCAVVVRRCGPERAHMKRMWGPEWAYTKGLTKRPGAAKRRESGTDPTGRRSGRRVKRGPVNRARTEGSRQDRDCLIDSLPAGYGYDGSR